MDSGFCVLKGLVQLASVNGVYALALIKKRRYWPKYIDGTAIDSHFDLKEIVTRDSLPGTFNGINFKVFCMKEKDYVMKLMATYGWSAATNGRRIDATKHDLSKRNSRKCEFCLQ